MKNYEKESLLKNFFVFFSLLEILLILLFIELHRNKETDYRNALLKEMQICSYSLKCPKFSFDFAPKGPDNFNALYEENDIHAHFSIPKSEKYSLRISYSLDKLKSDLKEIRQSLWIQFILISLLIVALALFFTFYTLQPIRKALKLNDEFIKDILHDFNTPITAMILNIKMCRDEQGETPFIVRLSKSIENLLQLQNNLKSFLHNSPSQNESFDVGHLIEERFKNIQNIYPHLRYKFTQRNRLIKTTNRELLVRIVDNLLTNAAKYNKPNGSVSVTISDTQVIIQDTGKGIKDIEKAFQRYYKEQDRGIGLGLHIVNKLCNELNIKISIESKINQGTKVTLDFSKLLGNIS
ncbi:MAG: hypothetical protein RL113_1295 [Pseudomonadota bacterium]